MYKSIPKPSFKTDDKKNIILDTITGELQTRPNAAKERSDILDTCHQPLEISEKKQSKEKINLKEEDNLEI